MQPQLHCAVCMHPPSACLHDVLMDLSLYVGVCMCSVPALKATVTKIGIDHPGSVTYPEFRSVQFLEAAKASQSRSFIACTCRTYRT
jgi:hypothetical protein